MKVITSCLPSFLHTADAVMNNILEMIFSIKTLLPQRMGPWPDKVPWIRHRLQKKMKKRHCLHNILFMITSFTHFYSHLLVYNNYFLQPRWGQTLLPQRMGPWPDKVLWIRHRLQCVDIWKHILVRGGHILC